MNILPQNYTTKHRLCPLAQDDSEFFRRLIPRKYHLDWISQMLILRYRFREHSWQITATATVPPPELLKRSQLSVDPGWVGC